MNTSLDLLRIDIDQAVRKLSSNRFKNATDSLVELISLAASTDPRVILVTIATGRVVIEAKGGRVDQSYFRDVACLFDPREDLDLRIKALKNVETSPWVSFLAAFFEPWKRVQAEQGADNFATGLAFLPGRSPTKYAPVALDGLRVIVEGDIGRTSIVQEVQDRCRFSDVPIYINKAQVNSGLHLFGCMMQRPFHAGDVQGVVGIPREGDLSVLYRLKRGIITEEVFLNEARGLILEAVVVCDLTEVDNRALYEKVRDAGRDLYSDAAACYHKLNKTDTTALKNRLLSRYEHSFDRLLVEGVPLFFVTDGMYVDLLEIKRRANLDDVFAVDKSSCLSQFALTGRFVLVLTPRERKFMSAALGIHPPFPPRRVRFHTWSRVTRRLFIRLRDRLRPKGNIIDPSLLTVYERDFIAGLKLRLLDEFDIAFYDAADFVPPFRRAGKTMIHIPRRHPSTHKMISAVLRDPAYIRWALTLLTRGALSVP